MTDLIESALSALPMLIPRRKVGYQRGSEVIWIDATVARSMYLYTDDNGVRIYTEGRDYLVEPSEIVMAGAETLPAEGDQVIDEDKRYTVMTESDGEVFRFTDRYHTLLRIHTKENDDEL